MIKNKHVQTMQDKHEAHIASHERSYGAKLGELKNPPSKKQLDKDYQQRKASGDLFSDTRENA